MGYRDKTVEFEPKDEIDNMVKSLIDELNPSLIISFYPGYSVHPDHEATAEAVIRTVNRMEKSERPKLHLVAFSNDTYSDLGEPDVNIDITGYEERKMKVLQAHASQTGPMLQNLASNTQESEAAKDMWLKSEHFWTYHIE